VVFEREVKTGGTRITLAASASAKLIVDSSRFVALGAEDEESTSVDHGAVIAISLRLMPVEDFMPLLGGDHVLVSCVIPDGVLAAINVGLNLALRSFQRLRSSLLHAFLFRSEFGITAKQNVGTAAGHVGGNGDRAAPASLRHDFGFFLVILGVEHDVLDALFLE